MKINILSRFIYVGLYAFLNIILAVLLLVTPGDAIRQALDNNQLYNVFVISGCYLLTLLLAIILYTSRLYIDSATLKAIPKTWIPVESGDVNKKVRKMVVASLDRSAVIAWNSRPRIPWEGNIALLEPPNRASSDQEINLNRTLRHNQTDSKKSDYAVTNVPSYPVWGEISHYGWSSPLSVDFPNLQYITVISELPLLIEAKAISLSSSSKDRSPSSLSTHNRAVEVLKRSVAMGLREYINYLSSLNVVTTPDIVHEFILLYEYSRFSTKPISEQEFKKLMNCFTEILRSMQPLDSEVLNGDKDSTEEYFGDDSDLELSIEVPRSQELTPVDSNSNRSGSVSDSNGTIRRGNTWFYEAGENLFKGLSVQ
ncbi:putative sucrase ferredoxin domain-containing protein [Erysiphe neolycopersici]|uniref:Defect at low temperature protein 1 n=1 Tax=Erysiphe neolycopersici TaxID=212602 RepID=A0A420I1D6_9PEZI|nr:putative sucrase ferredoxin domain-containing protein [Erysiphe neolycopersici]